MYALATFLCGAPSIALAQGRISGRTALPSGAEVSGAQVTVQGTTFSTTSDGTGAFLFPTVPVGTHTVRAARLGYLPVTQQVTVSAGATSVVIFIMTPTSPGRTMVSTTDAQTPLPENDLYLPVPDSAIVRRRQADAISFALRSGERGVVDLFPQGPNPVSLTIQATEVTRTVAGLNAHGTLVAADGSIVGSFVVVERNNRLTANIRHGLRLYQIRPQNAGISLIVEVDLTKVGSNDVVTHPGEVRTPNATSRARGTS